MFTRLHFYQLGYCILILCLLPGCLYFNLIIPWTWTALALVNGPLHLAFELRLISLAISSTIGKHVYSVAGPNLWNSLLAEVNSVLIFRSELRKPYKGSLSSLGCSFGFLSWLFWVCVGYDLLHSSYWLLPWALLGYSDIIKVLRLLFQSVLCIVIFGTYVHHHYYCLAYRIFC